MNFLSIDKNIGVAKYKQIIASVERALENGTLKKGDQLPSINSIRKEFTLSRDTVLLAFNELKLRGIVQAVAGKGYYVKSVNIAVKQKIFLLFDELNTFKENLYNAFKNQLDEHIEVDIYFHHFNQDVFDNLIYNSIGNYNCFIIMPANLSNTHLAIEKLPKDKVFILDQTHKELNEYSAIYQNFEKNIYHGLSQVSNSIQKYNRFVFIFSEDKEPLGMLKGFEKFCSDYDINYTIVAKASNYILKKGDVFLVPDDRNLIWILKELKSNKFEITKDIGIISYNDTLLNEIVEGGITTISTNFEFMGKRLAKMVVQKEKIRIENPSSIIIRNSI